MYLVVKLRFECLLNYFPQHEALCSNFVIIPEIPQTARSQFDQNPQALVWTWRQNFTFKINILTVNVPASTDKVFIFKLAIEDHVKNHSELIGSKFLQLSPIKSVAFFLGHPI